MNTLSMNILRSLEGHTHGVHIIEILAIATLYGISVFITRKSQTGSYYWEEVKPLKPEGLSYPVVPPDTLPSDFHVPSHIEICYYDERLTAILHVLYNNNNNNNKE